MKRHIIAVVAVLTVCCLCAACNSAASSSAPSSDTTSQTVPTQNLIDADITQVLSTAQVSLILGAEMTADAPLEYGSQLRMSNADGSITLDLTMREGTEDELDFIAAVGWVDAPNLPRVARWHPELGELMTWYDGYWLSIYLSLPDGDLERTLIYARELARVATEDLGNN